MPSSTGLGSANKTSSGNAGNRSTSQKLSNKKIVAVRGANPESSDVTPGDYEETSVQAPPSERAAAGNTTGTTGKVSVSATAFDYTKDNYRVGRQIDELDVDAPAKIQIRGAVNGKEIVSDYTNFFLQAVSEAEQEKYQIVETFTAYYAFFYGKRPPIYNYSGMLVNDQNNNWAGTFQFMYENYFRGTAAAELNAVARVSYGRKVVTGFILNLNLQQDAMSPNGIPFSFSMLVISQDLTNFGSSFKTFMDDQLKRLAELKAAAEQKMKELNSNPDTKQKGLLAMVLNGKIPPVFGDKLNNVTKVEPQSNKAVSTLTGTAADLAQSVLDSKTPTYADIKK